MSTPETNNTERKIAAALAKYEPTAKVLVETISAKDHNPWIRVSFGFLGMGGLISAAITVAAKEVNLGAISLVFFPCFALAVAAYIKALTYGPNKNTAESSSPKSREGPTE